MLNENTPKTNSAYYDFCRSIEKSWTFARMTENEKGRLWDVLHDAQKNGAIKGVYRARWEILNNLYSAYLAGLGYNGFLWREDKAT